MIDIARDLGVSLVTVSNALRNRSDVSEETRLRVLKRAKELGYRPNLVARSLAGDRSFLVGLVVPDLMHSFFAEVATGIDQKLRPLGYQTVVCSSCESAETELRQIKLLISRRVDGLIIASAAPHLSLAKLLSEEKVHYVLIDRMIARAGANFVGVKDHEIGFIATEHLIAQGCRRIAHLCGPMATNGKGRLGGYRSALAKRGLDAPPEYVVSAAHDKVSGESAMRQLLLLSHLPDGVFCYNDPVAAGAVKAILAAGLAVPGDIAVVGAGDVAYSDMLRVPLSTVNQSTLEMGQAAAELLLTCLDAEKPLRPKRIYLPAKLVERESSLRIPLSERA